MCYCLQILCVFEGFYSEYQTNAQLPVLLFISKFKKKKMILLGEKRQWQVVDEDFLIR